MGVRVGAPLPGIDEPGPSFRFVDMLHEKSNVTKNGNCDDSGPHDYGSEAETSSSRLLIVSVEWKSQRITRSNNRHHMSMLWDGHLAASLCESLVLVKLIFGEVSFSVASWRGRLRLVVE